MSALEPGHVAPDFALPGDNGATVRLSELKGSKLVLYFYPKADTSGCTKEAMAFNALRPAFAAADTQIIGVSPDPAKALDKFKAKYDLGFALAGDETHAMLEAYGVWAEKSMYGKTYMGVERSTFLIGTDGRVLRVWRKVKVEGHAEEVLAAAQSA